MTPVAHSPKKGYRTIRLPLAESEYDRFLTNRAYAKARLEEFYEDVPDREIAAYLDCRVGTVKSLKSRALARLREVIEQ